jgi:plasmid stabilization system protein ParE
MPKQYRVIVLPEAFQNLDRIIEHIRKHSVQNAIATTDRLWAEIQSLSELPHRYETYRPTRKPERSVRSMAVPPFIVYYRVIESPPTVRILTVRHGASRQPKRFK